MTKIDLQDKTIALEEDRSTPGSGKLWLWIERKRREVRLMNGDNILAQDEGDADCLNTRDQGEQVETLWESGKTIRHLTQEEGQVTWNKRGKLVIFKIKQELTRQDMNRT